MFAAGSRGRSAPILLVAGLALVAAGGAASAQSWEGRYGAGNRSYSQTLSIRRTGTKLVARLDVSTRGCVGEVEVTGPDDPERLLLKPAAPTSSDDRCLIEIRRQGQRLAVQEEGCLFWHGASCEFSGVYGRSRR